MTTAKKPPATKTTKRGRATATTSSGTAEIPPQVAPYSTIGRIPIIDVQPSIEGGAWPAKGTENESFPVYATVFREGHDLFAAEAVLVDPAGKEAQRERMVDIAPGLRRHKAWLTPTYPGEWSFYVTSWSDPYATWQHNAEIKLEAGIDTALVFLEAEDVLKRAMKDMPTRSLDRATLRDAIGVVNKKRMSSKIRFEAATSDEVRSALANYPLREYETKSATFKVTVDRERALVGSWYEIFPRTTGAYYDEIDEKWVSGTLRTAADGLDRIADMGFDVVYLTPVHPIGESNRKGKNNTLTPEPDDPGSPYAIGSADGGHDAIHPDLGTFDDFDAFVARARELGMEVALDIALQCSPDHPWVTEHPEWFTTRVDGTIAYAENPPKKYQDIYPLNFDNDPEGIYQEIKRVLEVWVSHGVTIFRVDNPHTKPLPFWQRLLAEFRATHPEVIFLAEAFTQPPMMHTLGKVGYHQSYCYFSWRNEKTEIEEYLVELATESDSFLRPAFWPTTHDILTPYMQDGGRNAYAIRAVLAATGSPTWGIYSGYELVENVARPGAEEQIDNEKYEYKDRDYEAARSNGIADLLTRLNVIRKDHVALRRLRNVTINKTSDEKILCFTKISRPEESQDGSTDAVIVVLNLDPHNTREATLKIDTEAFGFQPRWDSTPVFEVTDELSGHTFLWNDRPFVRLSPSAPAHVLSVKVLPQ